MRILYKDLLIGKNFHTGIDKNNNGEDMYVVFVKTSKSKSICVEQHGYGNSRLVGAGFNHLPFLSVFTES